MLRQPGDVNAFLAGKNVFAIFFSLMFAFSACSAKKEPPAAKLPVPVMVATSIQKDMPVQVRANTDSFDAAIAADRGGSCCGRGNVTYRYPIALRMGNG